MRSVNFIVFDFGTDLDECNKSLFFWIILLSPLLLLESSAFLYIPNELQDA